MTTLDQIQNRVYRLLSNPDKSAYDLELFFDALGAALDAILPWVPKTGTIAIEGDGSYTYDLPEDCYEVETVLSDADGEMLPKAMLIPTHFRGDNIEGTNDWIEYPHGSITFSKALTVGETYTLYYLAHWTKPTSSTNLSTPLETPEYVSNALALYTTAQMLIPAAISASEVRQFNTKVDSGNPEHNPMQETTRYLLKMFTEEMNRHPKYQKAQR
ncbi:hypothetical protein [Vibrio sp.]|uniref:hypothetical protein n=1 Tax=Vibrio sp. TaxID=678 RepID=UPI003D1155BE